MSLSVFNLLSFIIRLSTSRRSGVMVDVHSVLVAPALGCNNWFAVPFVISKVILDRLFVGSSAAVAVTLFPPIIFIPDRWAINVESLYISIYPTLELALNIASVIMKNNNPIAIHPPPKFVILYPSSDV